MNHFRLSRNSREKLRGVHPDLIAVVERALQISSVDFSVIDGLREYAVQVRYFKTGASKTLKSKHLMQKIPVLVMRWIFCHIDQVPKQKIDGPITPDLLRYRGQCLKRPKN